MKGLVTYGLALVFKISAHTLCPSGWNQSVESVLHFSGVFLPSQGMLGVGDSNLDAAPPSCTKNRGLVDANTSV